MALSKQVGTGVVQDVPDIAQHYLECGTEDCENNCKFYCNPCHQPMCKQCGDEIYTDKNKNVNVINRITLGHTTFIKTGDWKPLSIHFSHINGDILVGTSKDEEGKVTIYNKAGKEKRNIQTDNKGQQLYSRIPHYITENFNGDICVSDYSIQAVVVVNKSGQHRFSYTGQKFVFHPFGICTDILCHILVCDTESNTVHLLDQDGNFLSMTISLKQGIQRPRSVCVDNENNRYVGQSNTNIVTVFKYLQSAFIGGGKK